MLWSVCFAAAVLIVLLAVVLGVYSLAGRRKRGRRWTLIHVMIAACFLMAVVLCVPPYRTIFAGEDISVLKTVVLSFQKAIRVFGAEEMYDVVLDTVGAAPTALQTAYTALALAVQFLAPLMTFGFVLSFFKNLSAYVRYGLAFFRTVYVFSELNEKSLTLAADLLGRHPKARAVFACVREGDDGAISELAEYAKGLGAICFKKDIAAIRFGFHSAASEMYFFAIGDDELQNVEHSLKLIETMNTRDKTHLYIAAVGVEGELLLAGREKGYMKVRRVDEVRSLVYRVLYEQGDGIFKNAVPLSDTEKQISAVIVGLGRHGTEMLKALTWYCQMDGYHIRINAFDKDELAEERLAAQCPDLLSPQYNGVYVPDEAAYDITVHADCDVESKRFADAVAAIGDATYVFVSLGSDELNVRAAVALRMLCERCGAKPVIHAVISSGEAGEALSAVKNYAGQPHGITFVGDIESSYSESVIISSDAENDAWDRHKAYCDGDPDKEEDFWRYEYCYRSSLASTVHARARIACGIPGADKSEEALSPEERRTLETLEHRRWNAYMRAEGYVYSGSPDRSSRNDLAKMHHNLVVFDELSDADKRKDSRVGAKT